MNRLVKTCVHPDGYFLVSCHLPSYHVLNHRLNETVLDLGQLEDGSMVQNLANFPKGDIHVDKAQPIFEIPNAFPFWGATFILGEIARENSKRDIPISFEPKGECKFENWDEFFKLETKDIPRPVVLAIAQTCKNPGILKKLLPLCAEFIRDKEGKITGLKYERDENGKVRPRILDHDLYETLGNNPFLPDYLKRLLLLNPGIQGLSPIVGEFVDKKRGHIWEYLRANSYIPWGHFAANMAQDAVRYSVDTLDEKDIRGLRHLYYQRIFTTLFVELGNNLKKRGLFSEKELEEIRLKILEEIKGGKAKKDLRFSATLWGWNFGYDFSPSGFRLNASHQQIHQQFALIPDTSLEISSRNEVPTYAIGDSVETFTTQYKKEFGRSFFNCLIRAIESNRRIDERSDISGELSVFRDENVILFAPKAQRSQGELQLLCLKPVGNILEADLDTRRSIDLAILKAVTALAGLGARMITSFEISKRFFSSSDQRLMYSFLPKHPQSPGAFSEQQGRWITGHFPEDFASACRRVLEG